MTNISQILCLVAISTMMFSCGKVAKETQTITDSTETEYQKRIREDVDFAGYHLIKSINIKGINKENSIDSVCVLSARRGVDVGDAYYFSDTLLPILQTDSYCCHPFNLFSIDDIDEDGYRELVVFYSSCSSRFKSLLVYQLHQNEWRNIGGSGFDVLAQNATEVDYSTLVKKIKKNQYEICNFDENYTHWDTITIENTERP